MAEKRKTHKRKGAKPEAAAEEEGPKRANSAVARGTGKATETIVDKFMGTVFWPVKKGKLYTASALVGAVAMYGGKDALQDSAETGTLVSKWAVSALDWVTGEGKDMALEKASEGIDRGLEHIMMGND